MSGSKTLQQQDLSQDEQGVELEGAADRCNTRDGPPKPNASDLLPRPVMSSLLTSRRDCAESAH